MGSFLTLSNEGQALDSTAKILSTDTPLFCIIKTIADLKKHPDPYPFLMSKKGLLLLTSADIQHIAPSIQYPVDA